MSGHRLGYYSCHLSPTRCQRAVEASMRHRSDVVSFPAYLAYGKPKSIHAYNELRTKEATWCTPGGEEVENNNFLFNCFHSLFKLCLYNHKVYHYHSVTRLCLQCYKGDQLRRMAENAKKNSETPEPTVTKCGMGD